MPSFDLQLLPRHEMERTGGDGHGPRHYITPMGPLPSVTAVLERASDKSHLKRWRERIGDSAADKIVNEARNNGTMLHSVCEDFVQNKPPRPIPVTKQLEYKPFKKILRDEVETVYGVELPLWSEKLRAAGTADLFATWRCDRPSPDYYNAVIDYKTSKRWIDTDDLKLIKYKLQATTYAMMIEERYNMSVKECVIIALPNQQMPQLFQFSAGLYRDQVTEIFTKYYENMTIESLL